MDTELEALPDSELEQLALTIPVIDPQFRRIWTAYEARGVGMIAQVLKSKQESEQVA
jgi:hypothetical protein